MNMKKLFFKEENTKKQSWYRTLCILLIIILVASIGAMLVQTNFGKVRTMNISIVTDHQQQLNATLYIPQNASAENKVPLVITSSGCHELPIKMHNPWLSVKPWI